MLDRGGQEGRLERGLPEMKPIRVQLEQTEVTGTEFLFPPFAPVALAIKQSSHPLVSTGDSVTKRWSGCVSIILGLALSVGGAGCHSPSQYSSPRVTGRVLDEKTRQPIKNVQVRRVTDTTPAMAAPKGGEMLKQAPSIFTGPDGGFELKSVRDLAFIQRLQWYNVSVSFAHRGYEQLMMTYPLSSATNTPSGEPVVPAGDVLLKPLTN
jgi:hypothetical protein